jgi:hypothetical protein
LHGPHSLIENGWGAKGPVSLMHLGGKLNTKMKSTRKRELLNLSETGPGALSLLGTALSQAPPIAIVSLIGSASHKSSRATVHTPQGTILSHSPAPPIALPSLYPPIGPASRTILRRLVTIRVKAGHRNRPVRIPLVPERQAGAAWWTNTELGHITRSHN